MCGEKEPQPDGEKQQAGSPPRVRGKASTHSTIASCTGITPACAGKSTESQCSQREPWDHPRVCGEKRNFSDAVHGKQGSPPRVRGKAAPATSCGWRAGITPACAGKRPCSSKRPTPSRDHPRVCGEKEAHAPRRKANKGSPPRVRGKVGIAALCRVYQGITPACAGKSRR
mgnify:CR=1 FL=1